MMLKKIPLTRNSSETHQSKEKWRLKIKSQIYLADIFNQNQRIIPTWS